MKRLSTLFIFLSFITLGQHNLTLKVTGFKNHDGQIAVALYNNENQYTDNPYKSYSEVKSKISNDTLSILMPNLTPGLYAISFLDDENANNEMDYSFIGIPQEGFGFANDAKPGFLSPPDYTDCQFNVQKDTTINATVQYWGD